MLNEIGINLVESEDQEEGTPAEKPAAAAAASGEEEEAERAGGNLDDADIGRTDDPVRMYLREMGCVELLSREGEIAIAKRIEAGRDMMIGGIAESPLTYRALLDWRDAPGRRRDAAARHHRSRRHLWRQRPIAAAAAVAARGRGRRGRAGRSRGGAEPPRATAKRKATAGEEANRSRSPPWSRSCCPACIETLDKIAATFKKVDKLLVQAAGDARTKAPKPTPQSRTQDRPAHRRAQRPYAHDQAQQRPHRAAGRAGLQPQPHADRPRGPAAAPRRRRPASSARNSSPATAAPSTIRAGSATSPS